jgi:hypothetical protein
LKAPIKYDAEKRGFFYTNPDYTLDFIKDELTALSEIAESLGMAAFEPFATLSVPVLSTLAAMVLASAWQKNPLSGRVSVLSGPAQDEKGAAGRAIRDALRDFKEISIEYSDATEQNRSYIVRPLHLLSYKDECLLLSAVGAASADSAMPYLLLPMARIRTASLTGASFPPPRYVHIRIGENNEIEALLSMEQYDTLLVFSAAHPAEGDTTECRLISKTDMWRQAPC